MRAYAIDEFGKPGSVHEVPKPEPGEGQVRVKVKAASLNPFDNAVVNGMMKGRMEHHFPLIPCGDLAGTVDAVGAGVDQWKVGDEVLGVQGKTGLGYGSLAEFVNASAGMVAERPAAVDAEFAAALALAGVSAMQCVEAMHLERKDVVVVLGAAGGIGGYSVQIAKHAGATVVAVTRGLNAEYVRGLGADEVIDYATQDVVGTVRKAHPDGIAGVIHTSGDAETLDGLAALVREGGHVVSMRGGAKVDDLAKRGVTGVNIGTKITTETLGKVAAMAADGSLKRPEIKTFSLDRAAEAFAEIGTGHARGKLVVIP